MTREEAVARIKDHIEIHKYHEQNAIKIFEALDMAIKALEEPEQRWITSGKPMNSGMYLVTLRQKFEGEEAYGVRIMRFINGNWMLPKHFPEWINEEIEQEVLAWRELPEPWKEGETDD